MWDNANELKGFLKEIERLKVGITREINRLNGNQEAVFPTEVYPMAKVQPMIIDNYPVFQFSYDGLLPHNRERDSEYNRIIRNYYFRATFDAYDFEKINIRFKEAVIIFAQYFNDDIVRDLDNLNTNHIQNAIRHTGIIKDDNWHNLWGMNIGFKDPESNHVQVYLVDRNDFVKFYSYLIKEHEQLKVHNQEIHKRKEAILLEYQKEHDKKAIKSNIYKHENQFNRNSEHHDELF